jgi:hypothetical protein
MNMKKLIAYLLLPVLFAACGGDGLPGEDEDNVNPESVSIEPATLSLAKGDKSTLTAIIMPENATNKKVKWSSDKSTVAEVNTATGEVTAVAEGTAIITVTTQSGGLKGSINITVNKLPQTKSGDVFVAGQEQINGIWVARYWKNGEGQILEEGRNSQANSVYVQGNDVYVGGGIGTFATLWKNGVSHFQNYTRSSGIGFYSVFVQGADIYLSSNHLWKNGEIYETLDFWHEIGKETSNSVYVQGSDIYIAFKGSYYSTNGTSYHARLRKNKVEQPLQSQFERSGGAYSVFVQGSDVYVAGDVGNVACLWKNGVLQTLQKHGTDKTYACSVYVQGGNVYVAGYYINANTPGAILWKNGEIQPFKDEIKYSQANSVFVHGNEVYVAGFSGAYTEKACLWKNGELQTLQQGTGGTRAYSVFVR